MKKEATALNIFQSRRFFLDAMISCRKDPISYIGNSYPFQFFYSRSISASACLLFGSLLPPVPFSDLPHRKILRSALPSDSPASCVWPPGIPDMPVFSSPAVSHSPRGGSGSTAASWFRHRRRLPLPLCEA